MSTNDSRSGLHALADVPLPRRTDAAFARAVRDEVARHRERRSFALPALAAAAAAVAFIVMRPAPTLERPNPTRVAMARPEAVAIAFPFDDEDALFALPSLEGSSDEELVNLDRILDRRIAHHP
jgi:hypothetical protein